MASLENTHNYLISANVELTLSKNCDTLFSFMNPLDCSMGLADPSVRNPGKNTGSLFLDDVFGDKLMVLTPRNF